MAGNFGRGIVKQVATLACRANCHHTLQLLDWLAVDFMEHGWDIKRSVKQIVMSATYRQSDMISKKQEEKDPENKYLSHGPRNRLPAESIRDMVLSEQRPV